MHVLFVANRRRRVCVGVIDEYERDPAYEGDELPPNWFSWQKLWRYTGPGFLMSIAYLVWRNLWRYPGLRLPCISGVACIEVPTHGRAFRQEYGSGLQCQSMSSAESTGSAG